MKKATLTAIASYLFENVQYANDIEKEFLTNALAELNAEINRGADAKAQKVAEYDAVKPVVLDALSDTPVTIAELYDAVHDELPDGFTRGKLQYAVTKLWVDEIVKIDGKPNTYKKA